MMLLRLVVLWHELWQSAEEEEKCIISILVLAGGIVAMALMKRGTNAKWVQVTTYGSQNFQGSKDPSA